jgi:alkylation response protein AidB-like acyl-CoA dehydrogenase
MNFGFSEEQEELRKTVKRFLDEKSPESEVRRLMATAEGYDPAVWQQMANELALQGLGIEEKYGGQGYGPVELYVVFEEMGANLFCAPYFSTVALAANVVSLVGTDADKEEFLPGIASGETIATVALTDDTGDWNLANTSTTAERSDDSWVVNGVRNYVTDGSVASVIFVPAMTKKGLSLFAAAGDGAGVSRENLPTMDQTRKQSRVELSDAPARLVGVEGEALRGLVTTVQIAEAALAAEQVGGAQRVLNNAVEYAKNRVQFGRPIGSFQAIKHKCADMLLDVESAKSAAYYAAWAAQEQNEELAIAASLAKSFCSEAYFHCAAENIQIHGGIGFTWEHHAHLYFKRAKSSELFLGDPAYHRELLAQLLGI